MVIIYEFYYAFNQNAPQKYAGYNDLYDVMDWTVGDLVTKKVETTWWRLQFWKGKYGATYVPKISNGCEIGLYYRTIKGNPHWYCAYDRNRRIRMRMSLYVGNRKLFTRDSKTSTDQGKAWWLTAFVFKEDMPGKDIYSKTTLRMTGTLWFPKTGKYAKQMQTLSNKLKKVKEDLDQIEDIEITSSWFNNVEIMHKGVNKGEALKALINYLGIDKDEVIAFGDNYNDLPMLELAGIGVVMGNANDEVKEKGDYITAKNTEDGVAKAIYKFLKI